MHPPSMITSTVAALLVALPVNMRNSYLPAHVALVLRLVAVRMRVVNIEMRA